MGFSERPDSCQLEKRFLHHNGEILQRGKNISVSEPSKIETKRQKYRKLYKALCLCWRLFGNIWFPVIWNPQILIVTEICVNFS